MPVAFVPPLMRTLTNGVERVEVTGLNVRQVLEELELKFPGFRSRLCVGDELKPGISVAVDGHMSTLGLRQKVTADSEVHFLPAIGGG